MTRQNLSVPPAHATARTRRTRGRPTAAPLAAAAVLLLVVLGAYPLLDRAGSPVVQAVDKVLDPGSAPSGSTGIGGGEIPGGAATVDDDLPGITRLDPALADAVRQAAADAATDGVELWITSGWRSPAFQQSLLDEAVREHGSLEAARHLVATPETSAHVTGKAVDIGPTEADYWLIEHGPGYGLCQVYANEIWHFELLTTPGGTCPPLLEDATAG
ncbi:M15 family metallopeptidase [Promicromonospora sp. MS192]|uniref:M15 family metallopeptidase n=1 Tax=Promicromonospora sp. MS192 TaxID=3412684 RepID=UPI003C2AE79E